MSKPKRTKRDKNQEWTHCLVNVKPVESHDMRIPTKKKNRDVEIAVKRLEELKRSPEKVVRGPALAKKLKQWMS
jgi:hypothetical protein